MSAAREAKIHEVLGRVDSHLEVFRRSGQVAHASALRAALHEVLSACHPAVDPVLPEEPATEQHVGDE